MRDSSTESVGIGERTPIFATVLEPGTLLAGRYTVRSVLGSGGSAIVYAVHDAVLRSEVALKLLRPGRGDRVSLERLRREVALARQLTSSHIVRVFDIGECDLGAFLTMELCRGETLRSKMNRGPMDVDEAIDISTQVIEALEELHSLGIIHRDVKPSNVLFDESGTAKLADFGLALDTTTDESRLTLTNGVVGTIEYLSPEQAIGDELDARTDLYSVGVMLFEMLTGSLPFEGRSPVGLVLARIRSSPRSVKEIRPDIPSWLARFTARLLERERRRRFADASHARRSMINKSVPPRPRWLPMAAIATIVITLSFGAIWRYRQTRFDHLSATNVLSAVARNGNVLWRMPWDEALDKYRTMTIDHRPVIAVIRRAASGALADQRSNHTLVVLDAQTGRTTAVATMPEFRWGVFSKTFLVGSMLRTDLDDDHNDELAITYEQSPYYPSYTVVFDPKHTPARIVFIAAGHHTADGALDVDGDGKKELLFTGVANRMGWYDAVAAVKSELDADFAASPEGSTEAASYRKLVWYALIPARELASGNRMIVDQARRRITIRYMDGNDLDLTADGFTESRTDIPAAERKRLRNEAYSDLRMALRHSAASDHPFALRMVDSAIQAAARANDRILEEWASRVRIQVLVRAGQIREAEDEASHLVATGYSPSDIAFDVALQLDLHGFASDAAKWYLEGIRVARGFGDGRLKFELAEYAVLDFSLLHRWSEAKAAMARFDQAYPERSPNTAAISRFIDWRSGVPVVSDWRGDTDFARYVDLEIDRVNHKSAEALLSRTNAALGSFSSLRGPVLSLKAALLQDLRRPDEAWNAAREALVASENDLTSDSETRALFDLVVDRYVSSARQTHHPAEALAAERELANYRRTLR